MKAARMPLLARLHPKAGGPISAPATPLGPRERAALIARMTSDDAAGRYAASLAAIEPALSSSPGDPELLFARARTLFCWRRSREARAGFLSAEAAGLGTTDLYLNLGWACFGIDELEEAETWMRKALASDDDAWEPMFNLAVVLQARARHAEAVQCYQRALELRAHDFDCQIGLGSAQLGLDDAVAAEAQFRAAIASDASRKVAWVNLGTALGRQHRPAAALQAFLHAETLPEKEGEETDNFVNVAIGFVEDGRVQDALAVFEQGLPERPDAGGYYAYALALLKAGRLAEGWHYYEFRRLRDSPPSVRLEARHPAWEGQDLRGKTLLLHVEQGFGDVIQLVRYAPFVKSLGAKVVLRVSRPMKSLARAFNGIDLVVDPDEPVPTFDFFAHLFSLPRIFGTEVATIPAQVPYIEAPRELVERWSERLGGEGVLKVGVVWAGNPEHKNDRYRSLRLAALAPLWPVAGVRFISLQKGAAAAEWEGLPAGLDAVNLGPELADFTDTAAVISQLDLVICVDTAVAHLAGALGKPVWLLVAQPADFRWLEGREDSPWYPTMRLFRQSERGDWDEVIERVKEALQARVRGGTPAVASVQHTQRAAAAAGIDAGGIAGRASTGLERGGGDPGGDCAISAGRGVGGRVDCLVWRVSAAATGSAGATDPTGCDGAGGGCRGRHACAVSGCGDRAVGTFVPVRAAAGGAADTAPESGCQWDRQRHGHAAGAGSGCRGHRRGGCAAHESVDELRLERLDWLKVDDASGAAVLEGAADTLWRLRPGLFIAAADEAMLGTLAELAKTFSYRCWRLETALFNTANFNRRDTDIFAGGKALALLALPEEIDTDVALDQCVEI